MVRSTARAPIGLGFQPPDFFDTVLDSPDRSLQEGHLPTLRTVLPYPGGHFVDDHSQPDLQIGSGNDARVTDWGKSERPATTSHISWVAAPSIQRPFVWQCGRRLLLLEWQFDYWVLAELDFDPRMCRYIEIRRAFYEWEREAMGALLSRTIACGEKATAEAAELLDIWMRHRPR